MRFVSEAKTNFSRRFAPLSSLCFKTLSFSPQMTIDPLLRKSDYLDSLSSHPSLLLFSLFLCIPHSSRLRYRPFPSTKTYKEILRCICIA